MKYLFWGVVVTIIAGLVRQEYRMSQVVGHTQYRFNLAMIDPDKGVTFYSFDPREKTILSIPFPTGLAITSRTRGEYALSSLYKLGAYTGEGGKFARQKIQGFMRVPIPGYLVSSGSLSSGLAKVLFGKKETSLSRLDAIYLMSRLGRYRARKVDEDELVRAGVVKDNKYYPERLQEYVGTRLFDWGIGANGVSVAIVNASGENGLGSDMADFLTNLGLDVVMVRSVNSEELRDDTEWQVGDVQKAKDLSYVFQNLFGLSSPKIEVVPSEYRAEILVRVGKDAKELF